jgi:hypothetical protein
MQKLLLKKADASVNQVETTQEVKKTVESDYLKLQKIHNYIKLPPASFWSEHPPVEKSNNVIDLIIAELEEQRSLLKGINFQIERRVKAQELVIGDLETKTRLINSQAEVQQAKTINLLDLKLKLQKIAAQKTILEKQIVRNQADVALKQAQENALKARQVVIQIQGRLDQALEFGNEPKIKNTEKFLKKAKENLQRRLEAVNLASQKVEFAQQSLVEAQRQFEIEAELEINARTTLNLQQQTN